MSRTISSSATGPVVLGAADNPLSITSTGTVTSTGSDDGIDGGAGTTWTIANAGVASASSGNGVMDAMVSNRDIGFVFPGLEPESKVEGLMLPWPMDREIPFVRRAHSARTAHRW
jgi:hypothetical protein